MRSETEVLQGCADLARSLAEQARTKRVSPEALFVLSGQLDELVELHGGYHVERWVETISDVDGNVIERTELPG